MSAKVEIYQNSDPNAGTVSSVGLTMPSEFSVANSPITGSGTLDVTKASQNQNLVYASPNGTSGVPTFRALTTNDTPSVLNQDFLVLGTRNLTVTGGATVYAPVVGDISATTGFSATEQPVRNIMPYNITATGVKVATNTLQPVGYTLTIRLRDDGNNTSILLTINPNTPAGVYTFSGGSVDIDADSLIDWVLINAGASTSASAAVYSIALLFRYR